MASKIPRISTRGYYDLTSGKTIKKDASRYYFYPKRSLEKLYGSGEMTIMVHGLRNDRAGAVGKFEMARRRLQRVGYAFPVIGYSYDSNTRGAHLKKCELRALRAGQKIARKNGRNLARFVLDFKAKSPRTRIRLVGHSLGSQVILSAIAELGRSQKNKDIVESLHFFGASIPSDVVASPGRYGAKLSLVVARKIVNYFAPADEVLRYAHDGGAVRNPLGLNGSTGKTIPKYAQKRLRPESHRFKSYAAVLKSFP